MKKLLCRGLWLSSLLTMSSLLYAAPSVNKDMLSKSFNLCSKNAQGIIEQATCLSDESDLQDARLTRAYTTLQSKLNNEQRTELADSQQKWTAAKTSDSALESVLYDDSQPENLQLKLNDIKRVQARADQLEQYLNIIQ